MPGPKIAFTVREEILDQLRKGVGPTELAKKYGTTPQTIGNIRKRYMEEALAASKAEKVVDTDADPATPEGRLSFIKDIILSKSTRDASRLKAIELLDALSRQMGVGLGPPPPMTFEERVARLGVLMEVCGREVTDAAREKTFPPETRVDAEVEQVVGSGEHLPDNAVATKRDSTASERAYAEAVASEADREVLKGHLESEHTSHKRAGGSE
jgi:hypothetical protein